MDNEPKGVRRPAPSADPTAAGPLIRRTEGLCQSQKLQAIGTHAAGIAHEITTPTQYIGDNTLFLRTGFDDLLRVLKRCDELEATVARGDATEGALDRLRAAKEDADWGYLLEEIPRAIRETLDGIARITEIVRAMKDFSHPTEHVKIPTDLNGAIHTTVTVCRNEWKHAATIATELDPDLPMVRCLPGELNQALLNLIVNAAHAIAEKNVHSPSARGTITFRSRRTGGWVEIDVSDDGTGIPEEIRDCVYDPFFTTKTIGKGTGQGLTIARSILVDKLGGDLQFVTAEGTGTTFTLRIPIDGIDISEKKAA